MTRPLHDAFPRLAAKLPSHPIAQLPTPVAHATGPAGEVWIKRDGCTDGLYGGNKVRKLEYLLGQARDHGCTHVATFGAAGSNHATATAVHARVAGFQPISFLSRQRSTPWIADNLRKQMQVQTQLVYVDGSREQREQQAQQLIAKTQGKVWLVPMGGSSIAGTIGYVNAAFEIAAQIDAGSLPMPDAIYVPLGTMGTAVGLAIGLQALGLSTKLIAVRVVHSTIGSSKLAARLFERTVRALRTLDPSFPAVTFDPRQFDVREDQFGRGYAAATDAGQQALAYAQKHWQLALETTYSAKTVAALLADANRHASGNVLYWATWSEARNPVTETAAGPDSQLPDELMAYLNDSDSIERRG